MAPQPDAVRNDGDEEINRIESDGEYVRQMPLVEVFGDHPRARLLSVLLAHRPHESNVSGLCERADVSRNAWYDHRDALLATGLIEKVEREEAGNVTLYRAVSEETDQRIEWLEKFEDWTGAFLRDGARP